MPTAPATMPINNIATPTTVVIILVRPRVEGS